MEQVSVGMVGLGTVGAGAARILTERADLVARRAGRPVRLKWAAVRDVRKPRDVDLAGVRLTTDVDQVIADPEVGVVVEVIGGVGEARRVVLASLAAGKHVVTANKALLAEHGAEIFAQARASDRAVAFEASVGGGIPIVNALAVGLASNQVQALAAILNGTCNYILTRMTLEGLPYAAALAEAQGLGYAEADPTLDVDGTDAAHKLAILAQLAFRAGVKTSSIPRQGIDRLQIADVRYAGELGYTVKLLALAKWTELGLELRVAPALVKRGTPLAEVRGPYNAIRVVGDAVGDTLFYGRGAGAMPTASAVVGDVIDVAAGRALLTSRVLDLWSADQPPTRLLASDRIRSRYYLRFLIADRPGVLSALAHILGEKGISIASVIQHDSGDEDAGAGAEARPVPLVIMTHMAIERNLRSALDQIDRLDIVRAPSVCLGVED